jgi:HD-GYP domain-containing protein (c-di-GMP phosphodiesterase class II)
VDDLQIGMFVSELDRPWLGTPFLLQGFLVKNEKEISQLKALCKSVMIDRRRSVGEHYSPPPRRAAPPRAFSSSEQNTSEDDDFFAVVHSLNRLKPSAHRQKNNSTQTTSVEREIINSAPIIGDVHRVLESIHQSRTPSGRIEIDKVSGLVEEIAASIERNPDAMLWLSKLKSTDQYSYDHAVDVSVHLMIFGKFLGLDKNAVEQLGQAGMLQDIGKTKLEPDILRKPTVLSDKEFQHVQTHVAHTLEMLADRSEFSSDVITIIRGHHERYDGSGYPDSFKGDAIGLKAELAGLIDTFCAMTRHRPFRAAVSNQKAMESLSSMRGKEFRPALVDQFVQCIGLYPIGSLVELNTGEVAVVIQQNQVRRLRPRLMVLLGPDKSVEKRPINLDLMYDPKTPTGEMYRIIRALPSNAYGIDPAEFFLE